MRVAPEHDRSVVNNAGKQLVLAEVPSDDALQVINNWRAAHSFPLNTFQITLRRKARLINRNCLVAQRLKRLVSIKEKLQKHHDMKLSQMQDIGGCRAVLNTIQEVDRLRDLYRKSDLRHKLVHEDDYIRTPKDSGYRGLHLIYKYASDKKKTYDGLKIEIQIRSRIQHAWATAVETVGTMTKQSLKASRGEDQWLRFFAVAGTVLARLEDAPGVPGTPAEVKSAIKELRDLMKALDIRNRLTSYGNAIHEIESRRGKAHGAKAQYFLLILDPTANSIEVREFRAVDLELANQEYLAAERGISNKPGADAVLVSVESLDALRRAYPNYFLDTRIFLDVIAESL